MKKLLLIAFVVVAQWLETVRADEMVNVWPAEKANSWREKSGWLVGCNFTPSTAINELEMWQAATLI